jgi:DNA topoisomerase-1
VLRDGASGIFMSAHSFPRSRETRAVKVLELQQFKDRIPAKFHYLTEAPSHDDEGRETIVRFSRKQKEQYVMSEENGKPSGWVALYKQGKWQVETAKKAKK